MTQRQLKKLGAWLRDGRAWVCGVTPIEFIGARRPHAWVVIDGQFGGTYYVPCALRPSWKRYFISPVLAGKKTKQ